MQTAMLTPTRIRLLGIFSVVLTHSASAQWTLLEDFESYDTGVLEPSPFVTTESGSIQKVEIVADTPGTGGSKAAWFNEIQSIVVGDSWTHLPLPEKIPINRRGTIFFRLWQSANQGFYALSFSKTAADEAPNESDLTPRLSGIFRFGGFTGINDYHEVDAWGGDHWFASNPPFYPAAENWYRYWIVIDNTFNTANQQPPGVGGFSIYRQGPDDLHPVLMTWGSDDSSPILPMFNQDFEAIQTLVIASDSTYVNDPWLIDDIYVADTACVSDPTTGEPCKQWCEYPVVNDWAYTDNWLGWLFVREAPWLYSSELESWIYEPNCPGPQGAWMYLLKE